MFIYSQEWLKYRLYTSNCYRFNLDNGMHFIITERECYVTGKKEYKFSIFVQPGHEIRSFMVPLDVKRLKFICVEDIIINVLEGGTVHGHFTGRDNK